MSESRFNRIKFVEQTKVSPSCPIDIDKAALVLDTTENVVLLQLKLINIGSKVISSVFLKVLLKDAANDFIQNSQPIEHTYNDLNMLPGDKYGEKAPIRLLKEVRNVDVEVSKIVYEDGEIWKSENEKTEQIPKLTKLDILGNERISFLKSTLDLNSYDHTNLRYIPVIQNSSWICTCGRFNYNTNLVCKRCNISKEWIQSNFEEDNLDKNYNIFVKKMKEKAILEEKIDQEKKLEEEKNTELKKRIKTRRLRIVSISVFALLVIFSLGLLSTNYGKYLLAGFYMRNNNNTKALEIVQKLKNSDRQEEVLEEIYSRIARDKYDEGLYEEALLYIEKINGALDINQNYIAYESYINIAKQLINEKKYDEADLILNEEMKKYTQYRFTPELYELKEIVEENK